MNGDQNIDLNGEPMPNVPLLEENPVQRLRNHSSFVGGLHQSTSVVSLRAVAEGGTVQGTGSALIIADPESNPEFRLVTARHVVAESIAAHAVIEVDVICGGDNPDVLPVHTVSIPNDTWTLAHDDDLAVAPFPAERLPANHLVSAIHIARLAVAVHNPTPEVQLVGRWGATPETNFVLTRSGLLSTPQRPMMRFSIGGDMPMQERPMYLVDAFVTRGMSGGAVFQQSAPPMVLGIISAHAKIPAPVGAWRALPDAAQRAAEIIWDAITPMNAGLVYVVPVMRVAAFLRTTRRGN
jgi:S1-C subfamily serine protease